MTENVPVDNTGVLRLGCVPCEVLNNNAVIPTHGSEFAAGYDLYAVIDEPVTIPAGKTVKIGTGIAMEIPTGCFGALCARSGLATKRGLRPANCVGIVDSDYRGEVIVPLHNDSDKDEVIQNGERIAQLLVIPYVTATFVKVDKLNDTERGDGGFGSTGAM